MLLLIWGFYVLGNGLVPGALALGTLPLATLLLPLLGIPGRARAWGIGALAILFMWDLLFAWARLTTSDTGPPLAYCEDDVCGARPPVLASLIREEESAYAGIALMSFLGGIYPLEEPDIVRTAPLKYRALDALRGGRPGVNALLLTSSRERVRQIVWLPEGPGQVPGIVFLHGYGGPVTTYVSTLLEQEELTKYAIVAPALDWEGRWWSPEGLAVVERSLETLPARIDRDRLYLAGLSNGAVGVMAVAADPELGPRFQAVVALEGLARAQAFGVPLRPVLAVAAQQDERFSLEDMKATAETQWEAGAQLELVEVGGNHMAFYTHTPEITSAMAAFLREFTPLHKP